MYELRVFARAYFHLSTRETVTKMAMTLLEGECKWFLHVMPGITLYKLSALFSITVWRNN